MQYEKKYQVRRNLSLHLSRGAGDNPRMLKCFILVEKYFFHVPLVAGNDNSFRVRATWGILQDVLYSHR